MNASIKTDVAVTQTQAARLGVHARCAGLRARRQRGLTLVELVIALSIIGVIIAAGAYLSSVITNKNRVNDTINAVTLMAGGIRSAFAPSNSFAGLDNSVANQMGLVYRPLNGSGANITSPWGGAITVDGNSDFFRIVLPAPDNDTCIALAAALAENTTRMDIGAAAQALLTAANIGTNGGGTVKNVVNGTAYAPVTAATGCSGATPTITMHFK